MQWNHRILADDGFTPTWTAIERAVDQCIEARGFHACSQLLDGSRSRHADLRVHSTASSTKTVTFTSNVEVMIDFGEGQNCSTVLTHDQLAVWFDKPCLCGIMFRLQWNRCPLRPCRSLQMQCRSSLCTLGAPNPILLPSNPHRLEDQLMTF